MRDLVEQIHSSHQVTIPPNLPTILKKFAKAAIRTQPADLLVWSAAYFKALTYSIPLPVKERLEYPPVQTISGLTPGYLKVLVNQLGNCAVPVSRTEISQYWLGVCLSEDALEEIFSVGGFEEQLNWLKFIAICAGYLETCLTRTMILLCNILTEEPPGGSAHIPVHKFLYLYKYLGRLDCGPVEPEKPLPKCKTLPTDIGEHYSGEDISFKKGTDTDNDKSESGKKLSSISWHSVLKRIGKRESEDSRSTHDPDERATAEDFISRGIAWKKITDIGDTEPDTSQRDSTSECYGSSIGLQVFEHLQGEKMKKRKFQREEEIAGEWEEQEGEYSRPSLSSSESKIDLIEDRGKKTMNEILQAVEEFQTTRSIERAKDAEEKLLKDDGFYDEEAPDEHSPPAPASEKGSLSSEITDQEVHVLVEVDSSMILVPSPPPLMGSDDGSISDFKELEDDCNLPIEEAMELRKGSFSLRDVHVPQISIPSLLDLDEVVPTTFVHEQKWVNIPGIGGRVPEEQIIQVEEYMRECASKQAEVVMPRNIRHFLCPSLEPPVTDKEVKNISYR